MNDIANGKCEQRKHYKSHFTPTWDIRFSLCEVNVMLNFSVQS